MYERLKHGKHLLYERDHKNNFRGLTNDESSVKWTLMHRFHHIPDEILQVTQYPFIFSPNFVKYIDLEDSSKGVKSFVIRTVPTNKEEKKERNILTIPEEYMNANSDEPI